MDSQYILKIEETSKLVQ